MDDDDDDDYDGGSVNLDMNVTSHSWPRSPQWINSSVPVFVTCGAPRYTCSSRLKPLLPFLNE